jgi:hypothetical protein
MVLLSSKMIDLGEKDDGPLRWEFYYLSFFLIGACEFMTLPWCMNCCKPEPLTGGLITKGGAVNWAYMLGALPLVGLIWSLSYVRRGHRLPIMFVGSIPKVWIFFWASGVFSCGGI